MTISAPLVTPIVAAIFVVLRWGGTSNDCPPLVHAGVATGGMAEDTTRLYSSVSRNSTETNHLDQLSIHLDASNEECDENAPKHVGLRIAQEWTKELLALIFSSASLITIGVLLVVYHGRPIHNFFFGITLNGIVSILSTAYKASLLYAMSSALGQSKWNWYAQGPHRLDDFERIDEASRGPLGAFYFLYGRTKKTSVVSLAAVVVILALLIDPFSQQLVRFTESPVSVESDDVWTEVSTSMFNLPLIENGPGFDPLRIERALNGAIWNDASLYDRKVHCPTGNCTFPPFETLEWCSKTETIDVSRISTNCNLTKYDPDDFLKIHHHYNQTGQITEDYKLCEWFLDNDIKPLTKFSITLSLYQEGDGGPIRNTVNFPLQYITTDVTDFNWIGNYGLISDWSCPSRLNLSCPPLTVTYVVVDIYQSSVIQMEQSVLTLCTTMYDIDVVSGVQTYGDIQSQYGRFRINHTEKPEYGGGTMIDGVCFTSSYDSGLYPSFPNETSSRSTSLENTTLSFCRHLDQVFGRTNTSGGDTEWFEWGAYLTSFIIPEPETVTKFWNSDGDLVGGISGSYSTETLQIVDAEGLKQLMPRITAAMNNAWRNLSQERVTGSYIYSQTIFDISWAWIVLPVALNIFGYIVLVSVICTSMHTGQGKLWKGSTLASLYHGLQEDCVPDNVETVEAMEKSAATTLVELNYAHDPTADSHLLFYSAHNKHTLGVRPATLTEPAGVPSMDANQDDPSPWNVDHVVQELRTA
ncbi:hypothetical protein NPX13_g3262 [Xylaria arbuscula]|uniref:Uncharacterized protein n=1 Tax=Xylaria arbuscula TaxID=114810 RepID=A0A9W8NI32_9PEZI|nr:hypothetical protein NPX13_g3262 [Xylaria arbuscula]